MPYKDPFKAKECQDAWVKANRDKVRESHRKWRNSEKGRATLLKYRNSPSYKEKNIVYQLKNEARPERIAAKKEYSRTEGQRIYKRKWLLSRKYGLTLEQYDSMLAEQGGHCACCPSTVKLSVDHDHDTGQIRGILCDSCNTSLGKLCDDVGRLIKLTGYLLK